jgi:hypothetical protein
MTTDSTDHRPESWFHEAGGDACPHGVEPDGDSPEWDAWYDRHTGSAQDVRICLDAPAGEACGACSDDVGGMVPWSDCRARDRVRREEKPAAEQPAKHEPLTVLSGCLECLERECEEYFTDEGDEIPGKDSCSHLREVEICGGCSVEVPDGDFVPVVAWADCTQRLAGAGAQR